MLILGGMVDNKARQYVANRMKGKAKEVRGWMGQTGVYQQMRDDDYDNKQPGIC